MGSWIQFEFEPLSAYRYISVLELLEVAEHCHPDVIGIWKTGYGASSAEAALLDLEGRLGADEDPPTSTQVAVDVGLKQISAVFSVTEWLSFGCGPTYFYFFTVQVSHFSKTFGNVLETILEIVRTVMWNKRKNKKQPTN